MLPSLCFLSQFILETFAFCFSLHWLHSEPAPLLLCGTLPFPALGTLSTLPLDCWQDYYISPAQFLRLHLIWWSAFSNNVLRKGSREIIFWRTRVSETIYYIVICNQQLGYILIFKYFFFLSDIPRFFSIVFYFWHCHRETQQLLDS